MDLFDQYLQRSQEIIGDRTREEMRYDKEVLRWLRKGKKFKRQLKEPIKNIQKRPSKLMKKRSMTLPLTTIIY